MEKNNEETTTVKVYDLSVEVWKGYYAYGKIHHNGSVAKAMTEAYELLVERENNMRESIPTKLMELEQRIEELENKPEKPEDKSIKTLGGNKIG